MFGFFKLIIVFIVGLIILGASFFTSIFTNSAVSKDSAMNTYNNFLQDVSSLGITSDNKIQGERTFGIDEYVGTYKANYNNITKEETIFGGTALDRENGNTIKLKIKVDKHNGDIEIINKLGTENEILISDTGEIEKTIDVKEKSYYLIIKTNNFTGNVDIVSEYEVLKMESFKEKLPMIIAVIIVIALMVGAYYFLVIHKELYYTQIDNTKIQEITESGGMKYEYTLTAYNKNGKEKEIKFKTSRELREDAYLELEVMQIRGVVNWKEVQESELPEDVKTAMNVE